MRIPMSKIIFEDFRDKDLMPAYLADPKPNCALLDRRVICDLLGFGEEIYEAVRRLSAKWCAEPSVHVGKKRPKGARLFVNLSYPLYCTLAPSPPLWHFIGAFQ